MTDQGCGSDLVRSPAVRAKIAEYLGRWDLKAADVLDELRRVGFSDMRQFADWDGSTVTLKPSTELADDDAAAVAEVQQITTKDGGSIKFKLHDKLEALGVLAKFFGIVEKDASATLQARPINVVIFTSEARHAPHGDGVGLRFIGGNGGGQGDRLLRPEGRGENMDGPVGDGHARD